MDESIDQITEALVAGNLNDEKLMAGVDKQPTIAILPEANVIKIGGQSFIDRGRAAAYPLIEELVENLPLHKMVIGTGAGTRARHADSIGLGLGLPAGFLRGLGFLAVITNP